MTIPTRWLPRAAAAGRVAASVGAAAARRVIRRSEDDDRALGEALVGELDRLKGLSMKVGQILSTVEAGLPEETTRVLARLQRGAAPVDPAELRAEVEAGLGAPVGTLFDAWDDTPVAAASIGQVHRAVLRGVPVAVKVRYPGVREAIETDARHVERVAGLASLATAIDGNALARELRARLLEECDFRREAAWLAAVGGVVIDPRVSVPAVFPDRSCENVLTTGWVEGRRLEDLAGDPCERDAAAATWLSFTWRSLFGRGLLHADPHPGNLLFHGGGRLTLLDWGCVRVFTPDEVAPIARLVDVLIHGRRAAFPDALAAAGGVPDRARFDFDEGWEMLRWMWAPYLQDRYTFTSAWMREVERFKRGGAANVRRQGFPPTWVWLYRVSFGLHGALARVGATVSARAILEEALALPLDPLPDPTAGLGREP